MSWFFYLFAMANLGAFGGTAETFRWTLEDDTGDWQLEDDSGFWLTESAP